MATTSKEGSRRMGIESPYIIPRDEDIYQYDLQAKSLLDLPDTSKAVMAIDKLMRELVTNNTEKAKI